MLHACQVRDEADFGEGLAQDSAVRSYYLAIEEVDWNYAPTERNQVADRPFTSDEQIFTGRADDRIGATYRKAIYVQYTDENFTTIKPPEDEWQHRGLVGPVLHAVVGDSLEVVVRNNTSLPYSVHPHGVFYDKASEGADYNDGTGEADRNDGSIPPGESFRYSWAVPERAGPGPADPSSIVWMYHSHVDSIADTNAGLVGAIVVTRRDAATEEGRPMDVDHEFVSLFTVHDENLSHYLDHNIGSYTEADDIEALVDDEDFAESNLMHSLNGYVYGNGPMPTMRVGDRARWYLLSVGTEVDLHTPHWHGNTVLSAGQRTDVIELLPASMKTVDMIADAPGTWLYHCHVNDHISAGMVGRYRVEP